MIDQVTIGADPELFLVNGAKTNKPVVSAIGIIPGEKGNPWVGEDMPKGFGLEIDNILAEFNIPPVTSELAFLNNINYMKKYITTFIKNIDPHLEIKCSASEVVPKAQLRHPLAKLFGCSPDYNAYTENENPKPKGTNTCLRSAGFHVHIGYENPNIEDSVCLVKYLDAYVGLPSVIIDTDTRRRSLYGKAGAFRLTDYGVEYRVLSSAMMKNSKTIKFVFHQVMRAINAYNSGVNIPIYEDTIATINNSDAERAKELIRKFYILEEEITCADFSE